MEGPSLSASTSKPESVMWGHCFSSLHPPGHTRRRSWIPTCTRTRMIYLPGSRLWPSSLFPARVGREEGWLCYVGAGRRVWLAVLRAWLLGRGWVGNAQEWVGVLHPWGLVVLPSLVLVPLHTTPKAVEQELNALYDVFLDVSQRWQTKVGLGRSHRGAGDRRAGWPGLTAAPLSRT